MKRIIKASCRSRQGRVAWETVLEFSVYQSSHLWSWHARLFLWQESSMGLESQEPRRPAVRLRCALNPRGNKSYGVLWHVEELLQLACRGRRLVQHQLSAFWSTQGTDLLDLLYRQLRFPVFNVLCSQAFISSPNISVSCKYCHSLLEINHDSRASIVGP